MDLGEGAIREWQARADIFDRVAALFDLVRASDMAPFVVIYFKPLATTLVWRVYQLSTTLV